MAWWQLDGSADNYRENSTVPIVPLPTWRVASMTWEMVVVVVYFFEKDYQIAKR